MADIPDYYATAIVRGLHESELITLAVDSAGRIIMLPYGTTTIAGTATVSQAEKDREIKGADGVTLRTIAVDAAGRIIMLAKAMHDATLTNVLCDAAGNLQANLKVQDLSEIINRPKYGGALLSQGYVDFDTIQVKTLATISGKGMTYGGRIWCRTANVTKLDDPWVLLDGTTIEYLPLEDMDAFAMNDPTTDIIRLKRYDPEAPAFVVGIVSGYTFETSLQFKWRHSTPDDVRVYYNIVYALV